jgi:aromatic ring-opening dioxygenase catalytic subunit (LigB family)
MGEIVGAAIVAHYPGLMQPEEIRKARGDGRDTSLIAGFASLRRNIDAAGADTLVIFDTHWFTTGLHLVAGAARYQGRYTSSELPFSLSRVPYDYPGAPTLAAMIERVAIERSVAARNVADDSLVPQYATLNIIGKLRRDEKVLSVGCCQTAKPPHFLEMGGVIAEAIGRVSCRAVLLASGALSHAFNDLSYKPRHPSYYHPDNISDPRNVKLDREIIELLRQGRHDAVLARYPELAAAEYEGRGAHYLQMVGALGGAGCRARATACSEYENAAGTGNIHLWFDVATAEAVP